MFETPPLAAFRARRRCFRRTVFDLEKSAGRLRCTRGKTSRTAVIG
jgi:hypothetical protein